MREREGERVGKEVGESIRGWNGGRRGKSARKSSIQWPVSSREGTYVMPDVNARERGKNGGERDGGARRKREVQLGDPKPHELWWMNNGTPVHRNTTISPISL